MPWRPLNDDWYVIKREYKIEMSLLFKLILDWSAEKSDKAIGYFPRISDIFFVHSLLRCCERYFLKCSCSAILGRGVQCDGREELIRSQWLSFTLAPLSETIWRSPEEFATYRECMECWPRPDGKGNSLCRNLSQLGFNERRRRRSTGSTKYTGASLAGGGLVLTTGRSHTARIQFNKTSSVLFSLLWQIYFLICINHPFLEDRKGF